MKCHIIIAFILNYLPSINNLFNAQVVLYLGFCQIKEIRSIRGIFKEFCFNKKIQGNVREIRNETAKSVNFKLF